MRKEQLTYATIARSPAESVAPELWPDHAWVPALGCTGAIFPNATNTPPMTVIGGSWRVDRFLFAGGSSKSYTPVFPVPDGDYTLMSIFSTSQSAAGELLTTYDTAVTPYPCCLRIGVGGVRGRLSAIKYDGTNQVLTTDLTNNWADNNKHIAIGTFTKTTSELYVDGVRRAGPTSTSSLGDCSASKGFGMATAIGASSLAYSGAIWVGMIFNKLCTIEQISALTTDPLLPFRRRRIKSYFYPSAPTTIPKFAARTSKPRQGNLTYETIARNKAESVAPELWPDHAWVPALGCTGGTLPDVAGGENAQVLSLVSYAPEGAAFTITNDYRSAIKLSMSRLNANTGRPGTTLFIRFRHTLYNTTLLFQNNSKVIEGAYDWSGLTFQFGVGQSGRYLSYNTQNGWHDFTMVEDRSTAYFYADGMLKRSDAFTGPMNTGGLIIGNRRNDGVSVNDNYSGVVSHFIAYSIPLSSGQVARLSADPLLPFRRRQIRSWHIPLMTPPAGDVIGRLRTPGAPQRIRKTTLSDPNGVITKIVDSQGGLIETVRKI